jgi:hypothetical protein
MPIYKTPFNENTHAEYDASAKTIITNYFVKHGYEVEEGTKYGIDLKVFKDGVVKYYVEAEVKSKWSDSYPTISVPYRKKKFFDADFDAPVFMFMLINDKKECFIIPSEVIKKSPVINKDTTFGMDTFYDVPKEKIHSRITI